MQLRYPEVLQHVLGSGYTTPPSMLVRGSVPRVVSLEGVGGQSTIRT